MLLNRLHADAEFHRDLFVGFCEKKAIQNGANWTSARNSARKTV
jgi:hypothetical protein